MTNLTSEQAINEILISISKEESAVANVIDAESKKLKFAIEYIKNNYSDVNADKLIAINESAERLIEKATELEDVLKRKAELALSKLPPIECKPQPCPPIKPCRPICNCRCGNIADYLCDCVKRLFCFR